jgi:hypothetical protein
MEARLCIAWPEDKSVNLGLNQSTATSCRTYVRMVLRQHTPSKLKRLLLQKKSILVPTKVRVRGSKIVHCIAYSLMRQPSSQSIAH